MGCSSSVVGGSAVPRCVRVLIALLLFVAALGALTGRADAAGSTISIAANGPDPQPSGAASSYTINFTCSSVETETCGTDPTITIPLDLTSTNPATPDMSTWAYDASSSPAGLILSTEVTGGNYVIHLDPTKINPGDSDSIAFDVTPPNNITPDGTAWSLTPSFSSDAFPTVTAPDPALGAATAAALISVNKNTNDGGSVYVIGNNVIYTINAACNPGGSTGNLYLTGGSLVDALPPNLNYVSSSPAATVSGNTLTWDFPTTSSLPSGCAAGASGTRTYTVTAQIDPSTPDDTVIDNSITFSGTPVGDTTPQSTSSDKAITAVLVAPPNPGNFLAKSALGPLNIPGLGFRGTYAGHWLPAINKAPNSGNPGAAEGQYTVSINYATSSAYTTDVVDPMPCLTNPAGVLYSSSTVSLDSSNQPTIDNPCTAPAFNPTVVQVTAANLVAAITSGWTPTATLIDGTSVALTQFGGSGTSTYFEIPTADVGKVAAVNLPANAHLNSNSLIMHVWGYMDDSLQGGDDVRNIAAAVAYPTTGGPPALASQSADLYIEPSYPQLGVFKSFGPPPSGAGGTTTLNLQATLALSAPTPYPVVLTDLLPYGLSWSNPSTSASFSLTSQQGGTTTSLTATVQDIPNFNESGRELIRVTFPATAFTSGFYTLTAPTNFIRLTVPPGSATYDNTDQLFLAGSGDTARNACGPGSGQTPATFESSDPLDLDGDGTVEENYCQWAATLTVPPPTGSSFGLVKTVQGDLDSFPKNAPGIGDASQGGSGVYNLTWRNSGSTTLSTPVVYDIFPYIGDTGVSQNQAGTPRGSQFATVFAGVVGSLPPGIEIAYSDSTNPCRPEVNSSTPGCDPTWNASPGTLADVKAIRLTGTNAGGYPAGSSFSISVKVDVPSSYVNVVAWNSAATAAMFGGSELPAAEPPKVGLTAPAPPVTPTLSTAAAPTDLQPGDPVTDTVTVGNTGGGSGTLAWQLLGPVPAAADGTCAGLDWSSASIADSGTVAVSGDGSYTTATSNPTHAGCYTYVQTLTGSVFSGPVSTDPGASGETLFVHPADISTTASAVRILPGGQVTDSVVVSGVGVGAGTLDWTLVGPVAPAADGTCNGLDWSAADTADHGTISIPGDGTYETDASSPTATGCYSYVQQLTADSIGGPATTAAGDPGETVLVAKPDLSTSISSASVPVGASVNDAITVSGTGGAPGTLSWTLVGPVSPVGGSCTAAHWSSAPTVDHGTIDVSGDNVFLTPKSSVTAPGCYSYAVTLAGASYGGDVSSPAGVTGEVVLVPTPPVRTVDLTIVKRALSGTVTFGHDLTYQLVATNSGPATATDVQIIDTPGSKMTLVSAKPSAGSCTDAFPLTCSVGSLAPGQSATVLVVAKPLEVGTLLNSAHVESPEPNSAPPTEVSSMAKTEVRAPLVLTKTAAHRTVPAGGQVRFTLVVRNPTSATVSGLQVCDRLPAGLVFKSASVHMRLHNGSRCVVFRRIAGHGEISFTLRARVLGGASGRLANHATLSGSELLTRRAVAYVTATRKPPPGGGVTG